MKIRKNKGTVSQIISSFLMVANTVMLDAVTTALVFEIGTIAKVLTSQLSATVAVASIFRMKATDNTLAGRLDYGGYVRV